ncbi:hypothetical protein BS47DRAFT_1324385 [Hydnum rufescens UP504]|uniref:Uncharacterized protein n=1 Tax=Hydnum rufescens UP504 TaxID=1448309 RepID=A0A9P6E1Q3_9AGAM|nr:hypothetical protein BS47DRAFT_1324385 [Hydnum rufescens UP504]
MASVRLPERAEAFKEDGNVHFKAGEFSKAFISYTAAISEAPTSAVLYSNRSATAAKMGKYSQAVSDAKKSVELDPKWHKAHGRLATAHELNNEGSYAVGHDILIF